MTPDDLTLSDRRYMLRGMVAVFHDLEFDARLDGDTLILTDPASGNQRRFEAATFDPLVLDDLLGDCQQLYILRGMITAGERGK